MKNVSVTYVTLVPWRRERRRTSELTDELGITLGDQSTSSVRKRANAHLIIACDNCNSCSVLQREYLMSNKCITYLLFRWGAELVTRPYSGGTTTVATGRTSPFPPSGNEGYMHNRDVHFNRSSSTYVGTDRQIGDIYQHATVAGPSSSLPETPGPPPTCRSGSQGSKQRRSVTAVPQDPLSVTIG